MSQQDINKDNHLADFTDQVLQGKIKHPASSSDADMVHLEETILRLRHTLPTDAPDTAKTKQMLVRLKSRLKREEENEKIPFWKKLLNFQINPQLGVFVAIAAIFILAIIALPSLELGGSTLPDTTTGTATNSTNLFVGSGITLVALLLVYLIFRKK